jgi:hypothetical protein
MKNQDGNTQQQLKSGIHSQITTFRGTKKMSQLLWFTHPAPLRAALFEKKTHAYIDPLD